MTRALIALLATLLALSTTAPAPAADKVPHPTMSVDAQRTAEGQILLTIRLKDTSPDGITTTRTAPRLTVNEGTRAYVIVGTVAATTQPNPAHADQSVSADFDNLVSGLRIDVITVKGSNDVLVVATESKDSLIIWSDVQKVAAKPAPTEKQ